MAALRSSAGATGTLFNVRAALGESVSDCQAVSTKPTLLTLDKERKDKRYKDRKIREIASYI